ncbi:deoxyribodipyrimidine photo-lyase [Shigella flexneri]
MTTHLVWLRQDLRLHDNLALAAACRNSSARVLALYSLHHASGRRMMLSRVRLNLSIARLNALGQVTGKKGVAYVP